MILLFIHNIILHGIRSFQYAKNVPITQNNLTEMSIENHT